MQSDTHFKNRLEIVEEDLKQREQARSEVEEEKESLHTIVKEASETADRPGRQTAYGAGTDLPV